MLSNGRFREFSRADRCVRFFSAGHGGVIGVMAHSQSLAQPSQQIEAAKSGVNAGLANFSDIAEKAG